MIDGYRIDRHTSVKHGHRQIDSDYKIYNLDKGIDKSVLVPVNNKCEYYTEEQFNEKMMNGTLSISHFNSRSINCNLTKIKDYLKQFRYNFSIIAVTETWLKDLDEFQTEGYEMCYVNGIKKVET